MSVWLSDIGFQRNRFGSWMSVGRQANWKDETGDSKARRAEACMGGLNRPVFLRTWVEVGEP